jgi:hypothetical protein
VKKSPRFTAVAWGVEVPHHAVTVKAGHVFHLFPSIYFNIPSAAGIGENLNGKSKLSRATPDRIFFYSIGFVEVFIRLTGDT